MVCTCIDLDHFRGLRNHQEIIFTPAAMVRQTLVKIRAKSLITVSDHDGVHKGIEVYQKFVMFEVSSEVMAFNQIINTVAI